MAQACARRSHCCEADHHPLCLARPRQQPTASARCWPSTRRTSSSWRTMRSWPVMWVPPGSPGLAPARPCHPVLRDQAAPRTHPFLQIHPWAQSQTGHCPSSQQLTKGGLGSPRNQGWGWVRGQSGLWRAEFQAFSITSLLFFFFFHLTNESYAKRPQRPFGPSVLLLWEFCLNLKGVCSSERM